jgi:hypothetical protein
MEEQHGRADDVATARGDENLSTRIFEMPPPLARAHAIRTEDAVLERDERRKIGARRAPDADVRRQDGGASRRHGGRA